LTLVCAFAYAVHLVLTERYAVSHPTLPLAALQMALVAMLSVAVLPFVERRLLATPDFVAAVAVTGIVSTALALSLQIWAQARTTAIRAALIFTLEPVCATVWSVMRGRDTLGPRTLVGGGVILLAVLLSLRKV